MPRVQSKNLFNFPLKGEVDQDIVAMEKKMGERYSPAEMKKLKDRKNELAQRDDEESDKEYVTLTRGMMDPMIQKLGKHETFQKAGEEINLTKINVPTTHDGNFDVPVLVQTLKKLQGKENNAAFIYAHGGGVVASSAEDTKPLLDFFAVQGDVVVFNVDYRLAPETKCPNNIKDFYEAIKYICKNASSLGVDPSKISIGGDSGGGYICLGAMVLLAQNDEEGLVKLAIPGIPMTDDYCFSDPAAMTVEENEAAYGMRKIWKLIAADFEAQKNDPHLFPGKASHELLEKFPPTIIFECEFDVYITEATRLATRLRRAGRLLEFIVIPGAKHGSCMMPDMGCFKTWGDALKTVFQEYLHK